MNKLIKNDGKFYKWKIFCDAIRSNSIQLSSDVVAIANRANARFLLANNFYEIGATGITKQTLQGYSATFSVFLAYTAAEQIGILVDCKVGRWEIKETKLAGKLREQMKIMNESIDEHLSDRKLKDALEAFMKKESDNVRVVATAIRVSVAHGSLTTAGASARAALNRKALLKLSELLLNEAENKFSNWVDKIIKTPKSDVILLG